MPGTSRFSEVPVVDVNVKNIKEVWPSLVLAVKTATFVAMDTELSGLGNRKLLVAKSLPDRYKNLCEVARTRSVLSLGLSCYKLQGISHTALSKTMSGVEAVDASEEGSGHIKQWTFSVQTFNIMLLCSEDFMVEPAALKFLVEHGFDFNKQYATGVSYYRGKENQPNNETETSKSAAKTSGPNARQLFDILLWSQVPIVFHNGFVDLVFLYQNLYTDLPNNLQTFLADLAEMFPQGVLDTKYIVEFVDRLPASYLEYVFRKWQRRNALQTSAERREVCLVFPQSSTRSEHISCSQCDLPSTCVEMDYIPQASVLQDLVCQSFAGHGWCSKGKQCTKSHAIDLILDLDGIKTAKNRKRRQKQQQQQQAKRQALDVGGSFHDSMEDNGDERHDVELDASVESVQDPAGMAADQDDADAVTEAYLKSSLKLEEGRSGGHRAGFDAFMTGFIMACVLSKQTCYEGSEDCVFGAGIKLKQLKKADHLMNKVYATGKDQPLIVAKSNFASTSKSHKERIERVRKST